MAEIKFKKPRRKMERKTTVEEDSDEDRSDDESFKFVLLNIRVLIQILFGATGKMRIDLRSSKMRIL